MRSLRRVADDVVVVVDAVVDDVVGVISVVVEGTSLESSSAQSARRFVLPRPSGVDIRSSIG
jgi:hypothetical protein